MKYSNMTNPGAIKEYNSRKEVRELPTPLGWFYDPGTVFVGRVI